MNRLMVKPMPQSAAVPYSKPQLIPGGSRLNPNRVATQQKPNTPTCVPTNRPRAMPSGTL